MDSGVLCVMMALDQLKHVWLVGSWDSQTTLTMAAYLAGINVKVQPAKSAMISI